MNATGVACCAAVVAAMGCGEGGLYGDDIPDRIVVLYPVGGEELTAGGPVEVRWTSLGVEGNV